LIEDLSEEERKLLKSRERIKATLRKNHPQVSAPRAENVPLSQLAKIKGEESPRT
jgi:hypothetical protein